MGKIFDALEKADRDVSTVLPVTRKNVRAGSERQGEDNIVPLLSANRSAHGRKVDVNLVTYHSPQSVEAELFKVLRTNLLFPPKGEPPRTILVTSPLPGDGKSLVSTNIAVSIAQGVEDYVLLVDCDIRKPTVHSLFGYDKVEGLSEYLSNGKDISRFLLKTPIQKLTLLPGGRIPTNPSELLTSKKMKALLDEVVNRYSDRYIIIDSPPPSMAAETSAIAKLVDGVIIVVKNGKTPRKSVSELVEQIGKEKILGIVLNYSDQSFKKYYGHEKSYYATRQGKQG